MGIDLFFSGYLRLACPLEQATALFEALRAGGFFPKALKRYEKSGQMRFSCTLAAAARLRREFPELPLTEVCRGGLPILWQRLYRRPGLLCGLLLALVLFVGAHLFIWEVEVEGNETIPTRELLSELSAAGLSDGSFIPALDGDTVALTLRQGDGRVAYATVNLQGTVARVQIREAAERTSPPVSPADLVAKRDGVVVMPLIFEGECLVGEGDVVRAGQILASGIMISEKHGPRLTRAAGQVLARTSYTYTVTVPFVYEEKVATGRVGRELSLQFFGFQGIFFKTTGNITGNCDIIQNKEQWALPGGRVLPVGILSTRVVEYELRSAGRTAAEARALAMAELEAQLAADSAGRTLLERTVEMQADAEGITLICTVICEEDIAETAEFEVIS